MHITLDGQVFEIPTRRVAGHTEYYHAPCGACHGQGWLKASVPLEHKLFGRVRLCVCNPQYAEFGGTWFMRFDRN